MCSCGRVRAAEDAPRDPFRLLERRHGLAQIVERGIVVLVGQAAGACGFRFSGVPRELSAFITAVRKGGPVPRALSATEALVDLKVVEAICDAAAAKSAAGTRVAA